MTALRVRDARAPLRGIGIRSPRGRVITPASPEFGCAPTVIVSAATLTNAAWHSANDPICIPFTLTQAVTVYRLAQQNGSSPGDNFDIGIYDAAFNRMVSSGSTAATSSWQPVDVTDTPLGPGRYYLAFVRDTTTASRVGYYSWGSSQPLCAFVGLLDTTTDAFPLPSTLTNMAAAATIVRPPIVGFITRP